MRGRRIRAGRVGHLQPERLVERDDEITRTLKILECAWRANAEMGLAELVFEANPHGLPWKTSDADMERCLNSLIRPMGCRP